MKNFTISLLAFHLYSTFLDSSEKNNQEGKLLWENLAQLEEKYLPFPDLKYLPHQLICYDQNGNYNSVFESQENNLWMSKSKQAIDLGVIEIENLKIAGNLQPFILNDTYAADLTLIPKLSTEKLDISQLKQFPIKSLLPSSIQPSLGETFLIYGEIDPEVNAEQIANECVENLFDSAQIKPVFLNQGELFKSLLFEYEATEFTANNQTNKIKILVLLNNSQAETIDLAEKSYEWILQLLCCRHKINFIYQESRNLYPKARKSYDKLETEMKHFSQITADPKTRLESLQQILEKMPEDYLYYSRYLRDLKAHKTAIETNINNYKTCLSKIENISNIPQYWQDFLNKTCSLWHRQIETDINYLSPGQNLFEQMVNTIRGMAEIDQAESDRRLERTIQIIGVGLGSGGIIASSTGHIDVPVTFKPTGKLETIHPVILTLILSILATLLAGGITWYFTKPKNKINS
ncbi:hypothetical protein AFK68_21340 [Hydrocoleum sp. CS-953]|uniref:hypothetical protein n=1 Tax=Hydrocoleum sp. CS-953 TaxID=1671698 RepID=UPI000B9C57BF|nr:hypothetical protein [Hydrocoleum sp. CS-953]OZH52887.1 hypothetical protein AFK68_21340 [Hydrocoleum sp. CS-953]